MRTKRFWGTLVMLCVAVLLTANAAAQVTSARVEGVVKDQSDAIIPGATLIARNVENNLSYETISDDAGRYIFPSLRPGIYTISAELPGFKRTTLSELRFSVGDAATIDLILELGQITEEVTVTAAAPTVDKVSSSIGKVVEQEQIENLPLLNRNPMMLYYMQAGVNPTRRADTSQQQRGSVDGLRTISNNVTVEGVYAQDPFLDQSPANPSFAVPSESVSEYRVVTSSASAEYGRGAGAQVQVVYKSGTNNLHGSVYNYLRNTELNANNFFSNRQGQERPTFLRNQFGFALGGPIVKDRAFIFGSWEGIREKKDTILNRVVYTQPARQGLFRYYIPGANSGTLVDASGNLLVPASDVGTIDLLTVDPTRLGKDPMGIVDGYLGQTPMPNNYDIGDGLNMGGYRYNSTLPFNINQFVIKGDLAITSNHQLSLSTSRLWQDGPHSPQLISGYYGSLRKRRKNAASAGLVSTLTPNLLNEARLGASLRWYRSGPEHPDAFTVPNFQLYGLGANRGGGTNGMPRAIYLPQSAPGASGNIVDNMTWIKGNHTFKGGLDIRINRSNVDFAGDYYIPVISTQNSGNPATVPSLAGLHANDRSFAEQMTNDMTGAVGYVRQDFFSNNTDAFSPFEGSWRRWRAREYSFFFQDTWKVRPNLTVNLGIRYERFPAVFEKDGLFAQPVGGYAGFLGVQGPTGSPTLVAVAPNKGKDSYPTDGNNFAPNLGFTWDPTGEGTSSISANYRIAYDRLAMVTNLFQDYNNEGMKAQRVIHPGGRFSDAAQLIPLPTPEMFVPMPEGARQAQVLTFDPLLRTPYTQSWSLRIQQELMRDTVLQVAYVGNKSTAQWRALNFNQLETRTNGFLESFQTAERNLAANGDPNVGEPLGLLASIFAPLGGIPGSQNSAIARGEVADLADYIDRNLDPSHHLLEQAGLPLTFFRYNSQFQHAYLLASLSNSTWNGLKVELTRRFHQGLQFGFNYTFGKGLTDYDGGQSQRNDYRDNRNRNLDKSYSWFDSTHVVNANYIWEVPFGRGRRWGGDSNLIVNGLLGGWQVNGIIAYATGQPFTIHSGRNTLTARDSSTADFSGSTHNITGVTKGNTIRLISEADEALFSNPVSGNPGKLAQFAFRDDDILMLDTSIFKKFAIPQLGEEGELQFRFEMFNLINQTNFQVGTRFGNSMNINSSSFGVVSTAREARVLQFALRVAF